MYKTQLITNTMNSYQVLIKKLVVGNYPLAYFIIFRQSVLVATCVPFSNPELSSSDMAGARLASLGFKESSLKEALLLNLWR